MPDTVESILESYQDKIDPTDFGERPSTTTVNEDLIQPEINAQAQALMDIIERTYLENGPQYTNETPPDPERQTIILESLPAMVQYLDHYLGLVKTNNSYFKGNHELGSDN